MLKLPTYTQRRGFVRSLITAQVLAVVWWLAAVLIRPLNLIPIWYDQEATFTQAAANVLNPYALPRFMYPPWTAIPLIPFGVPPLSLHLSVLLQTSLYFFLLVWVIYKFGGSYRAVLIALTSFFALDNGLELNIEWMVMIGLLVPPAFSGFFLLTKPQIALGVMVSYSRRDFVRAVMLILALMLISFLLWGEWLTKAYAALSTHTLGASFNLAPSALMPFPVSYLIGAFLMWRAFRRRDAILSIQAWLFFVPYITFYSVLPHFALFAIRYRRTATIISVCMWAVYTIALGIGLARR
jgi:hypothetical protein